MGLLDDVARRVISGQADPDADRRRRAEELVEIASRQRRPLEHLRSCYLRRLHLDSADFDATAGLRVVELALTGTPVESEPRGRTRPRGLATRSRGWRDGSGTR